MHLIAPRAIVINGQMSITVCLTIVKELKPFIVFTNTTLN
jgi:hypothetical protein